MVPVSPSWLLELPLCLLLGIHACHAFGQLAKHSSSQCNHQMKKRHFFRSWGILRSTELLSQVPLFWKVERYLLWHLCCIYVNVPQHFLWALYIFSQAWKLVCSTQRSQIIVLKPCTWSNAYLDYSYQQTQPVMKYLPCLLINTSL